MTARTRDLLDARTSPANGAGNERVCIFVRNTFTVDARVLRQARTIAAAGHGTLVVAVGGRDLPKSEVRDGFEIRRVPLVLTWSDAFPRLTFARWRRPRTGEPSVEPGARSNRSGRQRMTPAPAPGGSRTTLRWILAGKGPPPRSWAGADAALLRRLLFTTSLLLRTPYRFGRRMSRPAVRRLRRARVRTRRRLLAPTRFRQVERRMAREAITFRPDVCWSNDADTLRPASAAARATGARLVYDAHEVIGDDVSLKRRWRLRWSLVERTHVRRAARVVTVCDPIADLMAGRYDIPRPIVVLNCPSLAETQHPPARDDSPLNAYRRPGEQIVLFHGSLSRWRGVEELILATKLSAPGIRLVVLGHGAHRAVLEQMSEREGVAERVTFLPSVPARELTAWLVGADLGTIPYLRIGRNHEYSTPNKLFEYMHLGIPVIANELPQVARIVRETGVGVVCDCSDPAVLARAIASLLDDAGRMREMSARARDAAPRYSWEREGVKVLAAVTGGTLPEETPRGDAHQNV